MKGAFKFSILLAGAALLCSGQTPTQSQDDAGVREAIRFERAKDAADARQARIEAAKTHQGVQEADRVDTSKKPSPMGHSTVKTHPTAKTDKTSK